MLSHSMAIIDKALHGKVALVTGASQGIGRAIAIALGRRGAKVIVNYLPDANGSTREADARAVAAEVEATGGQGDTPTVTCLPPGMPRQMNVYEPMEVIITPATTYLLIEHIHDSRRIYTDGRTWPEEMEPMFSGYSIGQWLDQDGDGRYDLLTVETRGLKGPRVFDASGIPLHEDNETVVQERLYLDKADNNLLHDDITTIDHALTRPWTVTKNYRRMRNPIWVEFACADGNQHVRLGKENYMLSADGYLMPAKKGQPPPDLKYFAGAVK